MPWRSPFCWSWLPAHDVLSPDPRRARSRHLHRVVLRRAGGCAQVGGGRLRQAAPDDGVALHHRLDHRESRVPSAVRVPNVGTASRRRHWRSVGAGARVRVSDPADVSLGSKRIVFQLEPRGTATRLQLHRPVHSRKPVQFPGEQRRAGGRAFLAHSGHRRGGCRRPGTVARRASGRQKRDLGGHSLRDSPDSLRTVCDCGHRGGDTGSGASEPLADLPRGVRRRRPDGQPLGAPRTGRRAHPDSIQRCAWRIARLAHHRVHRRRPVHRAAGPHGGLPHHSQPAQSRQRRAGPDHGSHRAGLVQFPPHGEASLPELRAVRGMVR